MSLKLDRPIDDFTCHRKMPARLEECSELLSLKAFIKRFESRPLSFWNCCRTGTFCTVLGFSEPFIPVYLLFAMRGLE